MLAEGPLPDFLERKEMMEIIHKKLEAGGYIRTGFECYSLPNSPMTKAFNEGKCSLRSIWSSKQVEEVNFLAVGSSSMSNLGNDYYFQNFYDIPSYKKALDKNLLPSFRGMKLNDDDKIRQHATQQIRSYFQVNYKNFNEQFGINPEEYFSKEINQMKEMQKDGLVEITKDGIFVTIIGRDFVQNIMNIFDTYDPPGKSYKERLETVKKAKEAQANILERL